MLIALGGCEPERVPSVRRSEIEDAEARAPATVAVVDAGVVVEPPSPPPPPPQPERAPGAPGAN